MPREYEQKQFALAKLLREKFIDLNVVQTNPVDRAKHERWREITIAFYTGWDDAKKWEKSEEHRQFIAVQAMNGLLSGFPDEDINTRTVADFAYSMADAMMKAAKEGVSDPAVARTVYEGWMRVTGEHLAKRISSLELAIQYAIDNRGSTFNYETWMDLCRDCGMDGKHTDQRG